MTDTHFELMNTLQNQRDQLAELVTLFAHDEYKALRTEAVDRLVLVHDTIQFEILHPDTTGTNALEWRIFHNTALIERLNAALIAMPDAAWAESERAT